MPTVKAWCDMTDDMKDDVREALEQLQVFQPGPPRGPGLLSQDMLEAVAKRCDFVVLRTGDIIQKEGAEVPALWIVMEGTLAKYHGSELVEHIQPGGQMGQLHMVAHDRASSTVQVDSEAAVCIQLRRENYDALVAERTDILNAIVGNLCRSLRSHVRRSKSARLVRIVEQMSLHGDQESTSTTATADTQKSARALVTALSGLTSMSIAFPLEVARTRLQQEGRGDIAYGLRLLANIVADEGIGACYKGWASSALSHTTQSSAYHSANDWLLATFTGGGKSVSDVARLILGVCAGCIAAMTVSPLSTVSFRLQGKGGEGHNPISMLAHIIRTDGLFSLWHGLGPSLLLSINPVITFYMFDVLKAKYLVSTRKASADDPQRAKLSPVETLVIGAAAKAAASALTFPLLAAKIRMGIFGKAKYPTLWTTLVKVISEEGVGGLFKGVGMSLMRSVVVAALDFMLRERLQDLMLKRIKPMHHLKFK